MRSRGDRPKLCTQLAPERFVVGLYGDPALAGRRTKTGYRGDRGMDYTRKVCSPAFRRPEPAKAGTTNADLSFIQRSRQ
ncbi:MAG: hypothetical protein HY735_28420 [Verrucomicrobia bacterium]|nr:hypothetical protein [Verrucomicrobiota bacterium]